YVWNNPTSHTDPSGFQTMEDCYVTGGCAHFFMDGEAAEDVRMDELRRQLYDWRLENDLEWAIRENADLPFAVDMRQDARGGSVRTPADFSPLFKDKVRAQIAD